LLQVADRTEHSIERVAQIAYGDVARVAEPASGQLGLVAVIEDQSLGDATAAVAGSRCDPRIGLSPLGTELLEQLLGGTSALAANVAAASLVLLVGLDGLDLQAAEAGFSVHVHAK
jgi:hypothetical protein